MTRGSWPEGHLKEVGRGQLLARRGVQRHRLAVRRPLLPRHHRRHDAWRRVKRAELQAF